MILWVVTGGGVVSILSVELKTIVDRNDLRTHGRKSTILCWRGHTHTHTHYPRTQHMYVFAPRFSTWAWVTKWKTSSTSTGGGGQIGGPFRATKQKNPWSSDAQARICADTLRKIAALMDSRGVTAQDRLSTDSVPVAGLRASHCAHVAATGVQCWYLSPGPTASALSAQTRQFGEVNTGRAGGNGAALWSWVSPEVP